MPHRELRGRAVRSRRASRRIGARQIRHTLAGKPLARAGEIEVERAHPAIVGGEHGAGRSEEEDPANWTPETIHGGFHGEGLKSIWEARVNQISRIIRE